MPGSVYEELSKMKDLREMAADFESVVCLRSPRKHDLTIPQFAERLGVSRVQIQRLVSGTRGVKRVNSALVALIERDTGGEVPRSVWSVATTLPAEDAS